MGFTLVIGSFVPVVFFGGGEVNVVTLFSLLVESLYSDMYLV